MENTRLGNIQSYLKVLLKSFHYLEFCPQIATDLKKKLEARIG